MHDYPHLANIEHQLRWRPLWQWLCMEPFAVAPQLFDEAKAEMTALMRQRGFPLPCDAGTTADNFRLFGVTVVKAHG